MKKMCLLTPVLRMKNQDRTTSERDNERYFGKGV